MRSSTADISLMSDFLHALHLPKLSPTAQTDLNSDITIEEIAGSIRSFPNGKAAGPYGFGIEFYKAYMDKVSPIMLRMFNRSTATGRLPDSLYLANISLILKKDKDETRALTFGQKSYSKFVY